MTDVFHRNEGGRLRAAFFCIVALSLNGCTSLSQSPMFSSLQSIFPTGDDVAERAEALPYASLDFGINGNRGLVVLATQAGKTSYWQLQDHATLVLSDGYLSRTAGFAVDLIDTTLDTSEAVGERGSPWKSPLEHTRYEVTRQWRPSSGKVVQLSASATLTCRTETEQVKLPLATLPLQRCTEHLAWQNGDTTQSTLWRSPDDYRLWAVNTQPWPGAPEFSWQVARPW